jgi:hypothetical protein
MKLQNLKIVLPTLWLSCLAAAAQTSSKLPAQITTLDGKTYHGVAEQPVAVYPDGVVVNYQPEVNGRPVPGGMGRAKLKFSNLPDDVQNLYPHDAKAAADFETRQAQAMNNWLQTEASDERAITRYRNLAELHRSLAGDADASYSVTLDSSGKVSAQGYVRPVPAETITNVSLPSVTSWPAQNPLFNWPQFVPVQTAPATVVLTR